VRTLHFDEIDSTNAEAHRLADRGERGPLWIVAKRQTGGRGRLGRTWISEPGNLYCTRFFSVRCGARTASQISFVASLAVFDTAAQLRDGDAGLGLKWPNDVLLDGAKFCGILPEVMAQPSPKETVIGLGIGINLAHAPSGMPYPVTALGSGIATEDAFVRLVRALDRWLAVWHGGHNFAGVRQAWEARAIGIGKELLASGEKGIFRGLGDDGALLLETPTGALRQIHSGEIRFAELAKPVP
jgi:BirA family biotin operon repressor/biotin-[acetyl-CoA-carboxylase] ligase